MQMSAHLLWPHLELLSVCGCKGTTIGNRMQALSENFVNQSSYHLLLSLILNGIHNRNVPAKVSSRSRSR